MRFILIATLCSVFVFSSAKSTNTDSLKIYKLQETEILDSYTTKPIKILGSNYSISQKTLQRVLPVNGNEVFRQLKGVTTTDEDGLGLRTNIGFRGLDQTRGRSNVFLEDGAHISLGVYGENDLYYTPPIDRMQGVEVFKGASTLLYGPQTIGLVVNYITPEPLFSPFASAKIVGGQGGYLSSFVQAGTGFDSTFSFSLGLLRKQTENVNLFRLRLNDFSANFGYRINPHHTIRIKGGHYTENSNAQYMGMLQTQFDNNEFVALVPDDRVDVEKNSLHLTYLFTPTTKTSVETHLYHYKTRRNWNRQDFTRNTNSNIFPSDFTGQIWGDTTITNGAVFMRNSNTYFLRNYTVSGFDSKLYHTTNLGGMLSDFVVGAKVILEQADEQLITGTTVTSLEGPLRNDEDRLGLGFSGVIQGTFHITDGFILSPILRYEHYNFERNIFRNNRSLATINNPDTLKTATTGGIAYLPGIQGSYSFGSFQNHFSIHRGYSPTRFKEAIDNSGLVTQLDPEQSWNMEVGSEIPISDDIKLSLTAFWYEFQNQIIPTSNIWGSMDQPRNPAGIIGFANGGQTRNKGFETSVQFAKKFSHWFEISFLLNYSFTDARFTSDRYISNGAETVNVNGNRLPYAPQNQISTSLGVTIFSDVQFQVSSIFVGKQYGDRRNLETPTPDGTIGPIDSYSLIDASVQYNTAKLLQTDSYVFVSVKNLLNERAIVSRRGLGIKLALPQFVTMGIIVNL